MASDSPLASQAVIRASPTSVRMREADIPADGTAPLARAADSTSHQSVRPGLPAATTCCR